MLAKRIIPTILCRGKTAYKGKAFDSTRSVGSALAIARVHARRGVDELCILDIGATAEGRGPDLDMVRQLSAGCFIPITVGGGIRKLRDIDDLLRAGADKVAICTGAIEVPNLIEDAASRFGRQAIVACVDSLEGYAVVRSGRIGYGQQARIVAQQMDQRGAGEILLASVKRDGMMGGMDLDLIRDVSASVDIPVIASGGCGSYEHMREAFKAGADAVAAGAMFAFTDQTPKGAAWFLKNNGLEMRV